ncbi:MAG: hypothetical protein ACM3XS_04845 [Bacteroidota bacterium]
MSVNPILLEKTGRGRGIAIGPGGRFYHVRIPDDLMPGDELPDRLMPQVRRPFLIAAAAGFLVCAAILVFLPGWESPDSYALVNLRFARTQCRARGERPVDPEEMALSKDIRMTLAVDRRGTVAAVRPQVQNTKNLVGMHVEEAIQYTVGQLTEIVEGGVEIRPGPGSTENETEALCDRIETALPEHAPPFVVAIGPPAGESPEEEGLLHKLLPRLRKPGRQKKSIGAPEKEPEPEPEPREDPAAD